MGLRRKVRGIVPGFVRAAGDKMPVLGIQRALARMRLKERAGPQACQSPAEAWAGARSQSC